MFRLNAKSTFKSVIKSAFFSFICVNQNAHALTYSYETSNFSYSEAISVYQFSHDFKGELQQGEKAFGYFRDRFAIEFNDSWRIGLDNRKDVDIQFSQDTALLYSLRANDIEVAEPQSFNILLNAQMTERKSIWLSRVLAVSPNFNLEIAFGLDKGVDLVDGSMEGVALLNESGETVFKIDVDYSYGEDRLFYRKKETLNGPIDVFGTNIGGFHLDTRLEYTGAYGSVEFQVDDLYSQLKWDQAPYTAATADTNVQDRDRLGYIVLKPLIKGIESHREHKSDIAPKVDLKAISPVSSYANMAPFADLVLDFSWYYGQLFSGIGAQARFNGGHKWGISWYPEFESFKFDLHSRLFFASFHTSSTNLKKSKLLAVSAGFNWQF